MSLSSSTLQAFAVEGITYSILCFLHVSDVDAIVSLFHETTELQGHLQDKLLWTQLLKQHFKGSRNIELRFSQHPMQDRGWNYTNRELTCVELQEFLHSMDECLNFDKTIQIVKGDIGDIQDIDGQTLDGIAFPTNSHLTNHYIGAAGAIFRRAGPNLSRYVNDPSFLGRRPTGSAVITP
ncbi:putative Macro domain-containing protein [Plasmopara halstedii]